MHFIILNGVAARIRQVFWKIVIEYALKKLKENYNLPPVVCFYLNLVYKNP